LKRKSEKNPALANSFEKARDYAFFLLKFRLRSENEIYSRLKKKKFDDEVIAKTLSFLKEKKFIDDRLFAERWAEYRIKKPFGLRRIKEELKLKGIAKNIIEDQLSEIKQDYSEEEIVAKIAEEKFPKMEGLDAQKAKKRLCGYLVRRGFSPEIVWDVINNLRGC